ncbi:hypothetical protein LZG04_14685 [Saccharothrix sp. S26]|uniref:hypothetical protein n=1 Tax=Saccharothrix sp. S26 TaxID=2907215 RepID=UPI001F4734D9|nr:hypothetical protein [Saccharothrix sp. S26]MCE6996040.1 hypothetical protein [Saccharothrix sp. S26]
MRVVLVFVLFALVSRCGVTTQDEPQPLVTSTANPVPTPTLTQRPDAPSSTTAMTTTTTSG